MYAKILFSTCLCLATTLGAVIDTGRTSTSSKASCLTKMGTKSLKNVPTSYSTSTKILPRSTITHTSRSTVKVTLPPKTIVVTHYTIKKTTTTLKTITKPFTTTLTETNTFTSTTVQTISSVVSETASTTATTTSTIPAAAGFSAIADTATSVPAPAVPVRRNVDALLERGNNQGCNAKQYPQSVQCNTVLQIKVIETAVVQGAPVTVTLPKQIVLSTTTATITKTEYQLLAKVTSTATQTTSTTITAIAVSTTTAVSTSTSTATTVVTASVYAACSTNNQLSSYNGKTINNIYNTPGDVEGGDTLSEVAGTTSATECCVACQQTSGSQGCQGYAYASGRCVILYSPSGVCATNALAGHFVAYGGSSYTVGNGPCGYFYGKS